MFILKSCPYCKEALDWMEELKSENSVYTDLEITIIDEAAQPEVAQNHDYYYVPTYFVDEQKVHEGAASKEIVENVFKQAL